MTFLIQGWILSLLLLLGSQFFMDPNFSTSQKGKNIHKTFNAQDSTAFGKVHWPIIAVVVLV